MVVAEVSVAGGRPALRRSVLGKIVRTGVPVAALIVASCGSDSQVATAGGPGLGPGGQLPSGVDPGSVGATAQFTNLEAEKMCISLQACLPKDFDLAWGGDLNDCINGSAVFYLPTPGNYTAPRFIANALDGALVDFYKCAKVAASDCEALGRCLSLDGKGGHCDTPAGLDTGACQGTVLSGCSADGFRFFADCANYSTACGEAHLPFATFQGCIWPPCSTDLEFKCDGTRAKACTPSGGEVTVSDCAVVGLGCNVKPQTDGTNEVKCSTAAPSPSCQPDPNNPGSYIRTGSCAGTVATSCEGDGSLATADCASFQSSKRCEDGKCVPTGTACDRNTATTCDGSQVVLCHDGFVAKVDCTALGFAPCVDGLCPQRAGP